MEPIHAVKGTVDILPEHMPYWNRIEEVVRETMRLFGYSEIRTPMFEETSLFARSIGEDTDIVGKEMYTFSDMGGRSLTLRPEGTASVVRAFIEHSLDQRGLPQKLWYMGPMFRQERPQKGRQRQFHQFGVEAIGSPSPMLDAEVMRLFEVILEKLGLGEHEYLLNCLGGSESRENYRTALTAFLDSLGEKLCVECRRRRTANPLRVLDCKETGCREAMDTAGDFPRTIDYLTESDRAAFEQVKHHLDTLGIRCRIDPKLVRGLDYYTGTVFELQLPGLGAQSAVMGGGRYDKLIAQLGGNDLPAVGFACGMERLILALKQKEKQPLEAEELDVYVITPDPSQQEIALAYISALRSAGLAADMDFLGRSMKAQMKNASRSGARFAVIVEPGAMIAVKDMKTSEQKNMDFASFLHQLTLNT